LELTIADAPANLLRACSLLRLVVERSEIAPYERSNCGPNEKSSAPIWREFRVNSALPEIRTDTFCDTPRHKHYGDLGLPVGDNRRKPHPDPAQFCYRLRPLPQLLWAQARGLRPHARTIRWLSPESLPSSSKAPVRAFGLAREPAIGIPGLAALDLLNAPAPLAGLPPEHHHMEGADDPPLGHLPVQLLGAGGQVGVGRRGGARRTLPDPMILMPPVPH